MKVDSSLVKNLADHCGVVLLYHGLFDEVPSELGGEFHNTTPEFLFRQLEFLSQFFRFVSIDEFAAADDPRGLAAVTADDGYRGILDRGLKVFEALGIPATLFLNRSFFEGGVFWRDKVRAIITTDQVGDFEQKFKDRFVTQPNQSFYRYTKDPKNNSIEVVTAIDEFLSEKATVQNLSDYYLRKPQELIAHPLISYGSHSVNHYVMSSLSTDQQWREIEDNRRFLKQFENVQKSDIFSVPFGGDQDYNNLTRDIAIQAGHTGLLLSRNRLQKRKKNKRQKISLNIERMMSRSTDMQSLVTQLSAAPARS